MRVLLSAYDSRGGVEPLAGLAHDIQVPTTESLSAALKTALTPADPRTSDRRGRQDPHRRSDGGRDAAARRGQPGEAASVRVNHAGSWSQDQSTRTVASDLGSEPMR